MSLLLLFAGGGPAGAETTVHSALAQRQRIGTSQRQRVVAGSGQRLRVPPGTSTRTRVPPGTSGT